jgi:hypothetical protein
MPDDAPIGAGQAIIDLQNMHLDALPRARRINAGIDRAGERREMNPAAALARALNHVEDFGLLRL